MSLQTLWRAENFQGVWCGGRLSDKKLFAAIRFSAKKRNSRGRHVEEFRKQMYDRPVRLAVSGCGRRADTQATIDNTLNFTAARARLHAYQDDQVIAAPPGGA